jgi:competence protein ComEA
MPRSSRLALCCLACLLGISLYLKGRVTPGKGEGAAFLRPAPGLIKVRLAGGFPRPGLYLFPDATSLAAAIKMTLPSGVSGTLSGVPTDRPLNSGDVVTLTSRPGESVVLSLGKMGVRERMLLKIPLDPDRLTAQEWSDLPGIGEVLAARIVADRQKNGAFGSLEGLLRVPGLGPGRVAGLKGFF